MGFTLTFPYMHTPDFDLPTLFTFDKGELKEGRKKPDEEGDGGFGATSFARLSNSSRKTD